LFTHDRPPSPFIPPGEERGTEDCRGHRHAASRDRHPLAIPGEQKPWGAAEFRCSWHYRAYPAQQTKTIGLAHQLGCGPSLANRLSECASAWGPDADRRAKPLIWLAARGSPGGADLQ
jgi:hypothetical protein